MTDTAEVSGDRQRPGFVDPELADQLLATAETRWCRRGFPRARPRGSRGSGGVGSDAEGAAKLDGA